MSFSARTFRILIASPSDVTEEREIAVKTIQEWNDLNSAERQVVLLPLRWETHSAPEYGRRPQEVLNRQIVDQCDLLVGIFWTRIGSPTGMADSGTLEEIERVASRGKPVMLYFSQAKQDPDQIDLAQLKKLREFKQKTFPKALVESYSSQIEFRDKLAKQIEIELRTLLAGESAEGTAAKPVTDIQFAFANPETGEYLGSEIAIESTFMEIEGADEIPDYSTSATMLNTVRGEPRGLLVSSDFPNTGYYRDLVSYYARKSFFRPVRFWLKNIGAVGARDCYVDIRISSTQNGITVSSVRDARLSPPNPKSSALYWDLSYFGSPEDARGLDLQQTGNHWKTFLELRALQPQREVSPPPNLVIGSKNDDVITVAATVYADTLAEPAVRTLTINWKVQTAVVNAKQLLKELLPPQEPSAAPIGASS